MKSTGSNLRQDNLTRGVLALAITLSEITKDALKLDRLHRMQQNGVSEEEIERWRVTLMDLDAALDQIKGNKGVAPTLRQSRYDFDRLVDHLLSAALNPDSLTPRVEKLEGRSSG